MKFGTLRAAIAGIAALFSVIPHEVLGLASDDSDYTDMLGLPDWSGDDAGIVYYRLDALDPGLLPQGATTETDGVNAISFKMVYPGSAWLALGLSPFGNMVGGEVMIGRPGEASSESNPSQFGPMTAKNAGGIAASSVQNYIGATITEEFGNTVMTFTKALNDGSEYSFNPNGENTLIWGIGGSSYPSRHVYRGDFTIDLSTVSRPSTSTTDTTTTNTDSNADYGSEQGGYDDNGTEDKTEAENSESESESDSENESDSESESESESDSEDDVDGGATSGGAGGSITLEPGLTLEHRLVSTQRAAGDSDAVEITLTYQGEAWLALGINPAGRKMPGSEVVLGKPLDSPSLTNPGKYSIGGYSASTVSAFPDDAQTLLDASITQQNGVTVLKFTKLLNEPGEHGIDALGTNQFVYAIGTQSSYPSIHQLGGTQAFALNLAAAEAIVGSGRSGTTIFVAHGIMALIAWAFLAPMAAAASFLRGFFPEGPMWFKVHMTFNAMVFLLTLVTFLLAVIYKSPRFNHPHFITGWVIMCAAILQVTLGVCRPHVDPDAKPGFAGLVARLQAGSKRAFWEVAHKTLGYTLLALTIWQMYTGLNLLTNRFGIQSYTTAYWGWMIAFYVVTSCLYILSIFRKKSAAKDEDVETADKQAS